MNILADASLPGLEQAFPAPFSLTRYHHPDEISGLLSGQEVLLCRANLKVNSSLLKTSQLRYVATASSGTDHLDYQWLSAQNIKTIDAKGCNASAVADYIVSCIAYLKQHQLLQGCRAGIIGFGEVGSRVQARLHAANFTTVIYDPLKASKAPDIFHSSSLETLYTVDLLCIHAELHENQPYPSKNLIDQDILSQLKPGCVIINAARGGIINENALLNRPKELIYCTDVYLNEPRINKKVIEFATLCTPHIAGHSLEAKYTAVAMISQALHQIAGLSLPQFATPAVQRPVHLEPHSTWEENILSLYNPLTETMQLKQAQNLEAAFLQIRKNHQQRHDFQLYANSTLDSQTQLLLGV